MMDVILHLLNLIQGRAIGSYLSGQEIPFYRPWRFYDSTILQNLNIGTHIEPS
jgi:hypothetical protein